jgi:hypothetical protein
MLGASEGYSAQELRIFVEELKADESEEDNY